MSQIDTVASTVAERKQHIHLLLAPELARRVRALAESEQRPLTTQIQILVERALALQQVAL